MRIRVAAVSLSLIGGLSLANAAESPYATLEVLDPRFDALIPADTKIEKIADDLVWSEGPLWDARRKTLLFSDIPRNVVMQWNADKGVSRFLENSGYTGAAPFTGREPGSNGLTFDLQGRLTLCQHGDRRVSRREADGTMMPLATEFQGKRLNSPNDLVFDDRARCISPIRRTACPAPSTIPARSSPSKGVFRVGKDGKITPAHQELEAPNGLAFSPDYKTLYVANSQKEAPIWKAYAGQVPTAASARAACSRTRASCTRKAMACPTA